jgi:hypothetical protein
MEPLKKYDKVKFPLNARQHYTESMLPKTKFDRQSEVRVWNYRHTMISVTCP